MTEEGVNAGATPSMAATAPQPVAQPTPAAKQTARASKSASTPKKKPAAKVAAKPTADGPVRFKEGETRDWQQLRVVDAKTGRTIPHVVAADASAGKVTVRKVESGSFVIENGDFALETVDRAVRIERTDKATA